MVNWVPDKGGLRDLLATDADGCLGHGFAAECLTILTYVALPNPVEPDVAVTQALLNPVLVVAGVNDNLTPCSRRMLMASLAPGMGRLLGESHRVWSKSIAAIIKCPLNKLVFVLAYP